MKLVHLNDDYNIYNDDERDKIVLLVSDYESGCYEGTGDSLELLASGIVCHRRLGHCSCYAPGDADVEQSWGNVAEFILAQDSIHGFSGSQELVDAFISEVYTLRVDRD